MKTVEPQKKHILVLGAGVIGLQTAVSLLRAGYDEVTVLAKHLPGDVAVEYTSPWAAAMWRSNALRHELEIQKWDRESYRVWIGSCGSEDPEAGGLAQGVTVLFLFLEFATSESYVMALFGITCVILTGPHEYIPDGPESIWYAPHVRNFKKISSTTLPTPFTAGATHDGVAVNTTIYLQSLASTIRRLGGRVIRAELPTEGGLCKAIAEAKSVLRASNICTPIAMTINATGLSAGTIVPDASVYPIRGQTVTVRGEAKHITTMFYPDANASITPRVGSGISVLGSTYQEGNWDPQPDPEVTRRILDRCRPLAPELLNQETGDFEVLDVSVAFRPGRTGGPRVEIEELGAGTGEERAVVCHEYGHAGGGYQNSFGSARKVVQLVNEWFRNETSNMNQAQL